MTEPTLVAPACAAAYAHSLQDRPRADWEPLGDHLRAVGERAAGFADAFGAGAMARATGLLHDIGKASAEYQRYIGGAGGAKGLDHSTAGGRAAMEAYGPGIGRLIAFGMAGCHGGLMNGSGDGAGGRTLTDRLDSAGYAIAAHDGWQAHAGPLPTPAELRACRPPADNPDHPGFARAFLARMLFSCLVDADWLETECFYAGDDAPPRGGVVLCTATQPALRRADGALPMPAEGARRGQPQGLDIAPERELAPRPREPYDLLRRVRVERLPAPVGDDAITARLAEAERMLCIVNSRVHARALFDAIRPMVPAAAVRVRRDRSPPHGGRGSKRLGQPRSRPLQPRGYLRSGSASSDA